MNQRQLNEMLERIKALEERMAQLESRKKPGPKPKNG